MSQADKQKAPQDSSEQRLPLPSAVAASIADVVAIPASSPTREAWERFRANWAAVAGLTVIAVLVVAAICAPFMHTTDPLAQHYDVLNLGPNPQHWLGTDDLGRDQYSRLLYGLRPPLFASMLGAVVTTLLGVLFGVLAAYYGGMVDTILSRLTDIIFAFPGFLLALVIVSFYGNALNDAVGSSGRLIALILVFAVVGWPGLMRFVRSITLSLKEQQFIEAARTCGTSNRKIITRHILPSLWGVVLVQASFVVIGFVYTEAVLSIFGLSVEPPTPDLGQMLYHGASNMGVNYWEVLIPTLTLIVIFLSCTFLADGLRDALDPQSSSL